MSRESEANNNFLMSFFGMLPTTINYNPDSYRE